MVHASTRDLLERHRREIRGLFVPQLAARSGRDPAEIRDEGLEAGDFKPDEAVELVFADGSTMRFRHAFAVRDAAQGLVGVFSEHCGYHCFGLVDLEVRELRGHEEAW